MKVWVYSDRDSGLQFVASSDVMGLAILEKSFEQVEVVDDEPEAKTYKINGDEDIVFEAVRMKLDAFVGETVEADGEEADGMGDLSEPEDDAADEEEENETPDEFGGDE